MPASDPSRPKTPLNGPIEMLSPKTFQGEDQETHPSTVKNNSKNTKTTHQNPINTNHRHLPPYSHKPKPSPLTTALQTFAHSQAAIMAPPPRPNPNSSAAKTQNSLASFNETTVFSRLLEGHRSEIVRLEGQLEAEKSKSEGLEAALAVAQEKTAVAQRELGATGGGKRRRVGGRRTY